MSRSPRRRALGMALLALAIGITGCVETNSVGGHVAGVALAHRLPLERGRPHALAAGLPMVLLMIGYTVLSLWIIAQPIVVDPREAPPEAAWDRLNP